MTCPIGHSIPSDGQVSAGRPYILSTSHTLFWNEYPTNKITDHGHRSEYHRILRHRRPRRERVDSTTACNRNGNGWRMKRLVLTTVTGGDSGSVAVAGMSED